MRKTIFLLVLALALASRTASAAERQPWRSTAAPAEASELLAFAQPEPGDEDSTGTGKPKPVFEPNTPAQPPAGSQGKTPTFSLPDTSRFNTAPLETLGPATAPHPYTGSAATLPTAPHPRRGVLGLHPLALLVGLIALHIFVVTTVVK